MNEIHPSQRHPSQHQYTRSSSNNTRPSGSQELNVSFPPSSYNNNLNSNHNHNSNSFNNAMGSPPPEPPSSFSRAGLYDDPSKRRLDTLAIIDNAEFGWFHVRACMVAGVGFFTDAYDLFAINLVTPMLGYVYFYTSSTSHSVPADLDLALKVSASVGTFFGQIGFGYLADRLGRKRMYGVELVIIIVATFAQALCGNGPLSDDNKKAFGLSVTTGIIIWRFILGIGVGGDYPLSAVITSEFATTNRRGAMMAAVFAMQGFGYLCTGMVAIVLLLAFRPMIEADHRNLDYVWRLLIGLGCVPALVAVYFRMTIPETPRFVLDVENNLNKAEIDVANSSRPNATNFYGQPVDRIDVPKGNFKDFVHYFGQWKNFKVLLGTSMTWFALDVAFYGIGLNNTSILSTIHFGNVSADPWQTMWNATVGQVIIVLLGAIPGYWVTVFTIERLGRIKIQVLGFVMSCILFCILGFAYTPIHDKSPVLFVALFAITQFFQNFGPNATTFIIPGEVFPTRYRSTGHGISAGMGKLGAIVAQVGFSSLKDKGGPNAGIPMLLQVFALFMFIGLLFTYLVPETKGKTLEELSGEDDYASRQMQRQRPNHLYEEKDDD
ncbi:MFS transporter, PHS family, inorganic phosphate transporter [Podila verticillata NRRL 6337]|nr:MFS transporter, PHS family, inorganic phosphate transporter [Podila verticillata NRRL 6337]